MEDEQHTLMSIFGNIVFQGEIGESISAVLRRATLETLEASKRHQGHTRGLNNLDLRGKRIEKVHIPKGYICFGWDLSGAQLVDVSFANVTVRNSCFDGATLTECAFTKAVICSTSFRGAQLYYTSLQNASLRTVGFEGARIEERSSQHPPFANARIKNTSFMGAHIEPAGFINSCFSRNVRFGGSALHSANFSGATVKGGKVSLRGSVIHLHPSSPVNRGYERRIHSVVGERYGPRCLRLHAEGKCPATTTGEVGLSEDPTVLAGSLMEFIERNNDQDINNNSSVLWHGGLILFGKKRPAVYTPPWKLQLLDKLLAEYEGHRDTVLREEDIITIEAMRGIYHV